MKPAIFFITGTSGSGKSTLVKNLEGELSLAVVRDIDEEGVPEGADETWRKQKTNTLLEDAKARLGEGKSTIICGVSVPEEIKHATAYKRTLPIHYGYIDVSEQEIRRRLDSRGWGKKLIEDNVVWASHLHKYVSAQKTPLHRGWREEYPRKGS